jgi:hypothetical protein
MANGPNPWDERWLKAMSTIYPVEHAVLPHWEDGDGNVDAVKTLTNFLRLCCVQFDPETGRISGDEPFSR